jgi:hypothetical protein
MEKEIPRNGIQKKDGVPILRYGKAHFNPKLEGIKKVTTY